MILSEQQKSAVEELLPIGRLALSGKVKPLQLKPRTHTLICAPSGSGKSYLMAELGKLLGAEILHLNVSSWQPFGSKSERPTWDLIVKFLQDSPSGIIVLDELDKLNGKQDWNQYVRLEVHDLLDGRIPSTANISDSSDPFEDDDIW